MSNAYIAAPFGKGIPYHTKEELNAVAVAAQAGNREAAAKLGEMMQPFVISYLRTIGGDYTPEQRNEMTQSAWLGVYEALGRWDGERDVKFNTYAHLWVKGEVQRWLAKNSGTIPLPRQAWADALSVEKEVLVKTENQKMPYEIPDEILAEIELPAKGRAKKFASAGAAFRARQQPYEVDGDDKEWQGETASAEDEFFDQSDDADKEALWAVEGIRFWLDMDDPEAEEQAWTLVFEFVDRMKAEEGIELDPHHIMEVARCG